MAILLLHQVIGAEIILLLKFAPQLDVQLQDENRPNSVSVMIPGFDPQI